MDEIVIYYLVATIIFTVLLGALLLFMYIYIKRQIKNRAELEEIRRKNEATLLKATLTAQENERERIGANLHDDIGPLLSSVKIFFKNELNNAREEKKEDLEAFLVALDENIEQVRNTSRELVPSVLHSFGLKAAVEEIIRRFSKDDQIIFNLHIEKDISIDQENELAIYRIIQESITNAIRHGKATKIQIEFLNQNGFLLKISDNGKGFDVSQIKTGLGLRNIEARAKSIDATFNVQSTPNTGTYIVVKSIDN